MAARQLVVEGTSMREVCPVMEMNIFTSLSVSSDSTLARSSGTAETLHLSSSDPPALTSTTYLANIVVPGLSLSSSCSPPWLVRCQSRVWRVSQWSLEQFLSSHALNPAGNQTILSPGQRLSSFKWNQCDITSLQRNIFTIKASSQCRHEWWVKFSFPS